jgi:NAD(P)-dependent dehydrogenase (short-subunit alcohol dehydrogenase family)
MQTVLIIGALGKLGKVLQKKYSPYHNVITLEKNELNKIENIDQIITNKMNNIAVSVIDVVLFAHRYKSQLCDISVLDIGDFNILKIEICTTINVIEGLIKNKQLSNGGKLILYGSTNDKLISQQNLYYHISKSSMNIMVKWFADRLINKGISVNGISMGLIYEEENKNKNKNKFILHVAKKLNINERPTLFDEVADLTYSLTSLSSNHLTGQTITIDGGFTLSDGYYMYTRKLNEEK